MESNSLRVPHRRHASRPAECVAETLRDQLGWPGAGAVFGMGRVQLNSAATSVRDLYRAWPAKRLPSDEDNLAAFCNYLSTRTGAPLRLEGLIWIANALRGDS